MLPRIGLIPESVKVAAPGSFFPDTIEKRMTKLMVSVKGIHLKDSLHEDVWERRDVTTHTVLIRRGRGALRASWNAS
jgi:hypothetical protein